MTEVIVHNQLQDLYQSLGIPIEQDVEFTIHALEDVHPDPIDSPIFRANYYSFLFVNTFRRNLEQTYRQLNPKG